MMTVKTSISAQCYSFHHLIQTTVLHHLSAVWFSQFGVNTRSLSNTLSLIETRFFVDTWSLLGQDLIIINLYLAIDLYLPFSLTEYSAIYAEGKGYF